MEHRTKQDLALYNLVSDFEISHHNGGVKYLDEKSYSQLIRYYEGEEKLDKAIEVAELAIKQFKYRAEFYITISHLYLQYNRAEQSLSYLEKAEAIAPYENEILLLKARAFCANGQYESAFACLEDVAVYASKQDQVEIHICEAYIHHEMHNYEQMYFSLTDVLNLDHSNTEALQLLWTATELTKKYIQSIAFHQELLDKDPYNYVAWYNLGHGLAYEGSYRDAADALEYSFLINEDFESGYMECADVLCQIKDHERALGVYEEAMLVFGVDSDLLTNIAECQVQLNRINEAKHNLYKAVRLEPHSDEIYFLLGECYSKQEKWYSAINAYHKAIEIEDGSEDYYLGVARAYIAVEEYNKATVNFQLAVAIGPEQTKYWNEFASFLIKMGLYDEAEQILDEAEEFTYGADLMYIRALIYIAQKDRPTALQLLEEALVEDYNAHSILFKLSPELEVDKEVASMINYYKSEQ